MRPPPEHGAPLQTLRVDDMSKSVVKPRLVKKACPKTGPFRLAKSVGVSGSSEVIMLSERDYEAFVKALDNPPAPNAALRKLAASK
jgi:hypothetical protein